MPGIDPTNKIAALVATDNAHLYFESVETRDALDFSDPLSQNIFLSNEPGQVMLFQQIITPPLDAGQIAQSQPERNQEKVDWKKCQSVFLYVEDRGKSFLEAFISKYPNSKKIPEAYYKLGHLYFKIGDFDKAIGLYEKLVEENPSTVYASAALENLVLWYYYTGKDEKSFSAGQKWLKRAPYQPINYYSLPPNYYYVRQHILLSQAEYYVSRSEFGKARPVLDKIVSSKIKSVRIMARGLLYKAARNSKYLDEWRIYLKYKISFMPMRGRYFLYERKDLKEAGKIFGEIISLSRNAHIYPEHLEQAKMALEEIKLRKIRHSAEALKAVAGLKKKGRLITFFKHQDYGASPIDLYGMPPAIYAQLLLLNSCSDVTDVGLAAYDVMVAKGETKTIRVQYLLIFKSKGAWMVTDGDRAFRLPQPQNNTGALETVKETLEKAIGKKICLIGSKKKMFAHSLREYFNSFRLSPYELVSQLNEQKLSENLKKTISFLKMKIKNDKANKKKLLSFIKAYSTLPKSHFIGLKGVDFDWTSKTLCGEYMSNKQKINLACSDSWTAVHEIVHHWDIDIVKGRDGSRQGSGDLSLIYYRISWDSRPGYNCREFNLPCKTWEIKSDAGPEDFDRKYGKKNELEDMATSAEAYVLGQGRLARPEVRKQLGKGNFEPAAKYLFNKYIRSFDPDDGYCFEYNLTPSDPPLSLREVKIKLKKWLRKHPNSISQSTLTAIKEIEREYRKQKAEYLNRKR